MGNVQLILSSFVFVWLCLPSPGHCQVNVTAVSIYPQQSITNGTVTLTCLATGFDPDVHMFTWQHSVGSSWPKVMADDRISFSAAKLNRENVYSQILTITNLTTSDAGSYLCVIKDNGSIIANGEGRLTVNSTEEFPVCFPDGPAVLNEGDILTCRTVIDERTPVVSDTSSPIERPDWIKTPPAVDESGSRLQKSVKVSDDGVTFFCFSIIPENQNLTSLSCKIGPLTVIPDPLTTPTQPQIVPTGEPDPSTTPTQPQILPTGEPDPLATPVQPQIFPTGEPVPLITPTQPQILPTGEPDPSTTPTQPQIVPTGEPDPLTMPTQPQIVPTGKPDPLATPVQPQILPTGKPDPLATPVQPQILPTEEPALPFAAIIGIAVGSFLLLLLLLLLIRTKCCRCKPKSYLLKFGGFFGSTIQRRQPTDRNQTDVEFSRQNPDGSDEPDPAHDGRVRISFDPDVLPIVKTKPNIYEERKGPLTSFHRETDPEEDAYWNENLKQQLTEAVDDEDDLSD